MLFNSLDFIIFFLIVLASLAIIKNRKYISNKHAESESKRQVSDNDIMKKFVDGIMVPKDVSSEFYNKSFNRLLVWLSKMIR